MGTTLAVGVSSDSRETGLQAIDSAFAAVCRVDDILNDWRSDTRLAKLNQSAPGEAIPVGADLWPFLETTAEWTRLSGGAFDPGIGALVDAWDLRAGGRVPTPSALREARERSGLLGFAVDSTHRTVRRPDPGSWIDAGGFGKGAGLAAARDQLLKQGVRSAILNFGGQIVALGDTTLVVEVAHPERRFHPVASLRLYQASVSTTSQSERFVEIGGRRFGHVLDPRSGTPVPGWGSVTIVHPDPMIADILSTALFVLGPDEGMHWLEGRGIAALFLVTQGDSVEARWSPAMQHLLITLPPHSRGN
jgi:thiamine biosynthesis lipoprotein